ncbi:MAG: nicotinate-nucleotide adenylyltransferase [Verrucomicrobiota bacterium]|nr:nicotinate-nucleotide adenylyltransferase [Verrucomicrobiota bacterium]
MARIGIYGGTFDPIHAAHLILAREALECLQLRRIVFVPAAISPHKLNQKPTPAAVRLEMVQAATRDDADFAIDDRELRRPPPSFAIDTIEEFLREDPDLEIYYLVGSDNLPRLDTWHRFDELRKLVKFVVLNRGTTGVTESTFTTIRRQIDISATEIRNRVATGRSIRYLVPPAVEEIIRCHKLYQEHTR